ncbi:APC family permease [Pimelobacter simplex]|uniref:APC family permease n=1 Tax=Nocardioides simplex TaxID=2045 RepID=UPI00366D9138
MTAEPTTAPRDGESTPQHDRLKPGAIGLVGVVFMVVAFSAPTTAMTGNLPVSVGFGNGVGAPAAFIVATVILTIFSVGFVALARHITAAGAFYTFVSRGWSRIPGLAAGVMSMFTYMAMEAGLIGIFSVFAKQAFAEQLGIDLGWPVFAVVAAVAIGALSHFDISVAAKVLGLVLVCEIAVLAGTAFSVLFQGGGPDGIVWDSVNPASAFSTNGLAGGIIGLGLLMAFWSWVGFESTAIYGEESKDPKRIVPQATLIAVIGIGVFYTFISWMTISGNGIDRSIQLAQTDPFELLYAPTREYVGEWGVVAFEWLVVLGSFACALAIHNSAARYLFAFGRDRLLWHRLGEAHPTHASPWVASAVQTVITLCVLAVCLATDADPYSELFVLVAILATICLLIVQTMCSFSTIYYFHVKKEHPETAHWWRTVTAPIIGGLGMIFVTYLMVSNMKTAAGAASETLFFKTIPYVVLVLLFGSMAVAVYWRSRRPDQYSRIGSTVFDEVDDTVV